MLVLVRNEEHSSVEYACMRRSIRLVQAENERVYAIVNPNVNNIPRIVVTKDGGGTGSVKVASVVSAVVVEENERMNLFKSLLFALPVVDASGNSTHLTLASITDEVKDFSRPPWRHETRRDSQVTG